MKELFERIEKWMDTNLDGWSTKERVWSMVGVIAALRPATVVEIGIWSGKSIIPMALAMQSYRVKGMIIGIDPWEKGASCEGLEGEHLKWWGDVNHETIYRKFMDEVIAQGVMPYLEIHRCRSDEFDLLQLNDISLLHIDGNHGELASVYDMTHYLPKVKVGGFLMADDETWCAKAAKLIPEYGFEPLYPLDGGHFYQRTE